MTTRNWLLAKLIETEIALHGTLLASRKADNDLHRAQEEAAQNLGRAMDAEHACANMRADVERIPTLEQQIRELSNTPATTKVFGNRQHPLPILAIHDFAGVRNITVDLRGEPV